MIKRLWLFCIVLLILAGCGGAEKSSGAPAQAPSGGYAGYAGATKSNADSASSESTPSMRPSSQPAPPPADFSPGSSGRSASTEAAPTSNAPAPRERQGLGTEWGESRQSRVHDVTFVRADHDRPSALAQLFYNDRNGVDALANFHASRGPRLRGVDALDGALSVSIRDDSGDSLETLRVGDRSYVVGQAGTRYTIVLQNHTQHRFEAVATVDGLDVINGKTGTLDNRGYVVMPFATLEIDGFRQSQDAVAAFRFGAVADSYAAQTGTARNVGVIGIAFFSERGDSFVSEQELRLRDNANPFPGSDPRFAQPPRR
jgi:hypothetical protein